MNVLWILARAWRDSDGEHVWMSHECEDGYEQHILPPPWKADELGEVHPSVKCSKCGLHTFLQVMDPKEQGWTDIPESSHA